MDLDGFGVDFEAFLLVDKEVFHGIALVALKLNNFSGAGIRHNGAVASKLLLNDLEDFFEIEFGRNSFDGGQGFASIALLNANVDIGRVRFLTCLSGVLVLRIREGIERLEVLDLCGHTILCDLWSTKCREGRGLGGWIER